MRDGKNPGLYRGGERALSDINSWLFLGISCYSQLVLGGVDVQERHFEQEEQKGEKQAKRRSHQC